MAEFDKKEMSLGDHLDELRSRVLRSIIAFFLIFIVSFYFHKELKEIFERPVFDAMALAGTEICEKIGLDPSGKGFKTLSLQEPALNSIKVAFLAAIGLTFPFVVFQMWGFVTPALHNNEKFAGFLFVPLAIIFFYIGVFVGYFFGLPYLYYLLFEWAAASSTADMELRESEYLSFFAVMTISFGIIMNIPWLVMVLVYVRLVTPDQLADKRGYIALITVVLAAILSPPDPVSQLAMFLPMYLLFELGLVASRFITRKRDQGIAEAEAEVEDGE